MSTRRVNCDNFQWISIRRNLKYLAECVSRLSVDWNVDFSTTLATIIIFMFYYSRRYYLHYFVPYCISALIMRNYNVCHCYNSLDKCRGCSWRWKACLRLYMHSIAPKKRSERRLDMTLSDSLRTSLKIASRFGILAACLIPEAWRTRGVPPVFLTHGYREQRRYRPISYRVAYLLLPLENVGHWMLTGELYVTVEDNALPEDSRDVDRVLLAESWNKDRYLINIMTNIPK